MSVEDERPIEPHEVDEWEVVGVSRPPRGALSAVLTVRFTADELRGLRDAAERTGASMGEVVRQAVQYSLRPSLGQKFLAWSSTSAEVDIFGPMRRISTLGEGFTVEREAIKAS